MWRTAADDSPGTELAPLMTLTLAARASASSCAMPVTKPRASARST